jgi:predicted kinase
VLEIAIPDPCLVVLIGAAGSGKSTFAARHFEPSEILSSDAFRALISGDPADQSVSQAAFGWLHRDLVKRLTARQLTVVDATNIDRGGRRELLRRASAARLPAVAIVFDLPADVVLARNASRVARVVDHGVVRRHLARMRDLLDQSGATLGSEGFQRVWVLRDPEGLDGVKVTRTAG